MKTFGRLALWVGLGVLWVGPAWGQCWFAGRQPTPDRTAEDVTVSCNDIQTSGAVTTGCCERPCSIDMPMEHTCSKVPLEAWLEHKAPNGDWTRVGSDLTIQVLRDDCGPCCDGGVSGACSWVRGEWQITGDRTVRLPCGSGVHQFALRVRYRIVGFGGVPTELVDTAWIENWPACELPGDCVTEGPHRGDGCCDPARNADPARGNNLNDACIARFDRPGDRRNCCRPAGMLPPGGERWSASLDPIDTFFGVLYEIGMRGWGGGPQGT